MSRRTRGRRMVGPAAVAVAAALGLGACSSSIAPEPVETVEPVLTFAPPASVPVASPPAPGRAGLAFAQLADPTWLTSTAEGTGIPERALAAYAAAAITSNAENPTCAASWNTLAGIGWVESQHGAIFDGTIDAAGTVSPPVFGVPLDGSGVAEISDSDAGVIDGDTTIDRAVGPMQLIPDTWRNWHVDANRDGVEDPHNLDDASLAAVHYLCRAGGDLSTEEGWGAAILAWNRSENYLQDVAAAAVGYAEDAG